MINFIKESIDGFKSQKKSTKFWCYLYLALYFSCMFLCIELFIIYQFLLFVMLCAYSLDTEDAHPIFVGTSLITLFVAAVVMVCIGISFVFSSALGSFNNWLDKPKKENKP